VQVTLPDGAVVLARGRLDIIPPDRPRDPDFALYLDDRWRDDPDVTWPNRILVWMGFGLEGDEEAELFAAIRDLHRRIDDGELVEVACYGGVGRTATVLACLAILAGVAPSEAVTWVRRNYHPESIEDAARQEMVTRFAQTLDR
jgi:hypothetical protein